MFINNLQRKTPKNKTKQKSQYKTVLWDFFLNKVYPTFSRKYQQYLRFLADSLELSVKSTAAPGVPECSFTKNLNIDARGSLLTIVYKHTLKNQQQCQSLPTFLAGHGRAK